MSVANIYNSSLLLTFLAESPRKFAIFGFTSIFFYLKQLKNNQSKK